MMYGYDGGWTWLMMPVWFVLMGVTVWLVLRLVRSSPPDAPQQGSQPVERETPEEIIDRRFATGEIDGETYSAARERLKESQADRATKVSNRS